MLNSSCMVECSGNRMTSSHMVCDPTRLSLRRLMASEGGNLLFVLKIQNEQTSYEMTVALPSLLL